MKILNSHVNRDIHGARVYGLESVGDSIMKKILVIGGNGFIGQNVVTKLLKDGYTVGVYDIRECGIPGVCSYVGDVLNDKKYEEILQMYDRIVYLISAIMPQKSMDEPMSAYQIDIPLMLYTLELCKKNNIKRIIYSSSGGTIYGDYQTANTEDRLTNPINHYAICKLTCEKILCLYNQLYGMENVVLRIANPYGFGQRLESGVGAITNFAYRMLRKERIIIFGDGENIRDYIPIEEVANAVVKAIEWKFDRGETPIFNVGSGVGLSINKVIQIIAEEIGIDPQVEYRSERNFDVRCNYLDMTKTERVFGNISNGEHEENIRKYVRKIMKIIE